MTLDEIKAALSAGKRVFWKQPNYEVIEDCIGQYLIRCSNNDHCIGLTWRDGVTMNGKHEDFYLKGDRPWRASLTYSRSNGGYDIWLATFDEAKRSVIGSVYGFVNRHGAAREEGIAEDLCALAEDINLESGPFRHECRNYVFEVKLE